MRDTHKLKEKYELSLDNAQIVTLTVASLVVLGGVFALGVVVGKKLSGETAEKPQTDLLSQLDQKNRALDSINAAPDAALTFQDELTRRSPVAVVERPVEKKVEDRKPEERKPEPKPVEKPVEVARVDPPLPQAIEPRKEEPKKVEEPKLPESPSKSEPVATRTHDGGGLKEAFGKVQRPPTETAADGSWTVQLSAYQDRNEADRFAAGLRDKGYAPYIVEANVAGKGTWFRVRMGRFASKDAASRYLDDFKRETSMSAIVTSAN
jgi:cell division protein FtsN